MKSILGFGIEETPENAEVPETVSVPREAPPVRSLVSVRFPDGGRELTYYNDRFDLAVGDRVFVSGKLAGTPGVVEKVTTRFRICLSDYQRVISKAFGAPRGSFEAMIDKMVSYDRLAMPPEDFRSWILPARSPEGGEDILCGDGYELSLSALEEADEASREVLDRAVDYCRNSKVAYISVIDGIGTAFIEGTHWYEVDFRLRGDRMSEMYCDCPYPGLCKHLLAAAITIRTLAQNCGLDTDRDFIAVEERRFWGLAAATAKRVTL